MAVVWPKTVTGLPHRTCCRLCWHHDDCCRFFSRDALTRTQITGDLLFFCGSSSWAVFTLLLGRYPVRPLAATVATTLGSALVYVPVWWLFLPSRLTQAPVGEIAAQAIYQGVLVVSISMLLYSFAINRLGSHAVALQMAFVPVISALAAVPCLGEPIPLLTLGGLIAVTAGAILGARAANEIGPERRNRRTILFIRHNVSAGGGLGMDFRIRQQGHDDVLDGRTAVIFSHRSFCSSTLWQCRTSRLSLISTTVALPGASSPVMPSRMGCAR